MEATEPGSRFLQGMGASAEFLLLAGVLVTFFVLSKLYARWPRAEAWLVAGTLAAFIPAVSIVLPLVTGRYGHSQTFLLMLIIAPLMGGAWWLIKHKTDWLASPGAAPTFKAESPAAVVEPPPQRPSASVKPEVRRVEPPRPEPAPPAPSAPARPVKERIFISYRRHDSADVTGRIYDRLIQRFGKDQIFKDVDSIPLGVDFREHLGSVVGRCNLVLAVIGDQWLRASADGGTRRLDDSKDFVRIELESALERKIPVIPLLVRGALVPSESDLPPSLVPLAYRNGIAVRSDPDFHRDMDRLIAGLEAHLDI